MHSAVTFLEVLGCLIAASALSFWLGRVTRDKEVQLLRGRVDFLVTDSNTWKQRAIERLDQMGRWRQRAVDAEGKLPKRGDHGRFSKKA